MSPKEKSYWANNFAKGVAIVRSKLGDVTKKHIIKKEKKSIGRREYSFKGK